MDRIHVLLQLPWFPFRIGIRNILVSWIRIHKHLRKISYQIIPLVNRNLIKENDSLFCCHIFFNGYFVLFRLPEKNQTFSGSNGRKMTRVQQKINYTFFYLFNNSYFVRSQNFYIKNIFSFYRRSISLLSHQEQLLE